IDIDEIGLDDGDVRHDAVEWCDVELAEATALDVWRQYERELEQDLLMSSAGGARHRQLTLVQLVAVAVVGQRDDVFVRQHDASHARLVHSLAPARERPTSRRATGMSNLRDSGITTAGGCLTRSACLRTAC